MNSPPARPRERLQERVLILAPTGRDGPLTRQVLERAGFQGHVCQDGDQICQCLEEGVGAVLLAEEALTDSFLNRLLAQLEHQPPWSAIPLVVLTSGRRVSRYGLRGLRGLEPLRKVTYLERPIRMMTLLSTVQVAIEARRRQYQVRDLLARAEESVRQRDEFLAMLGHELRNPLAAVSNAIELLKNVTVQDPLLTTGRDILQRQTTHLVRLLDDLLDVSRITRGKVQLRREPVELARMVHDAVEGVRELIRTRHHRLELQLGDEELWLDADPTRLRQIIGNLLSNAAKYTESHGRIRLTLSHDQGEAVLSVKDSGVGMNPETLVRVFDLFAQAERSLDRSQGGLGVGLTVARQLVEMHGGRIEAFSAGPGRGSELVVHLPLLASSRVPVEPLAGAIGAAPVQGPVRRVLLVDDNQDLTDSLGLLLRRLGHQVFTAHDGPQALEVAARQRPEVVLLDLGLPGMDGYEVARRLRQVSRRSSQLLVAMTGYGRNIDRRRSREAGFDHHLIKPVRLEVLRQLLEGCSVPTDKTG